ncbi:hypothetical protein RvY_14198 [Ramazzottius varieornatus]|uniref:Uncharacterized protein n=1 Tax=Ramazzottius varieornatus TaxID=947166 RepID=A0A1D1VQH8_RAMVA|nr:hypothetical protein RvY_14198 [Ramazzottius varieornatus]
MAATSVVKTTIEFQGPDSHLMAVMNLDIPQFSTLKDQTSTIVSNSITVFHSQLSLYVIPRRQETGCGTWIEFGFRVNYLMNKGQTYTVDYHISFKDDTSFELLASHPYFRTYAHGTASLTKEYNTIEILSVSHKKIWTEVPLLVLPNDTMKIHV